MVRALGDAVDGALQGAAKPYGISLTIWGTATTLASLQDTPTVGQVFLFAAGIAAAYGLLRVSTRRRAFEGTSELAARKDHIFTAGAFHVAAIGGAIGAAALIGQIDNGVAWPLAAFAATLVYLTVIALELLR